MKIIYVPFMFWAVDMVLDDQTMWTRRKENIKIYERKFKTMIMRSKVWFIDFGAEEHWRFLHELWHMKTQSEGLTRRQWVWKYIKKFWFYEYEADDFANKNLNKRPFEIYDLIYKTNE